MGNLMDQFGEAIAAFTDHPVVRAVVAGATFYVVLLWLAAAFWAFQDLRRRHHNPAMPYLAAAAIILVSPLLFPLAIVVYRTVRPAETLAESRERELNDRLVDLEAAESLNCPGCGDAVEEQWVACPACRTRLAHRCLSCHRSMGLDWTVCAWCATEFGRPVIADVLPAPVAEPAAWPAMIEPNVEPARA
jgi:Double zinc ribbon